MKKLTAILLLCGMIMTAFASCASKSDDAANNTDTAAADTSAAENADLSKPDLPEKDYGGYTFNAGVTYCGWANYLFDLEEQDGDVVNDAIYERNSAVEEAYNIKIVQNTYDNIGLAVEAVNTTVMSGDDTYSIFIGQANMMMMNSQTGNFVNLYDVPYLDLSYDFWDQNALRQFTVGDKLYGVTGDIHLGSFDATWMLFFDKVLIADNNLTSPYDYVENDSWTFDKFTELSAGVTKDLNGDGIIDENDMWGFSTHTSSVTALILAAGADFVEKTDSGEFRLAMGDEKFITAYERAMSLIYDNNTTFEAMANKKNGLQVDIFVGDRSLFYAEVMGSMNSLREKENDFGVLIWPKLNEAQEDYHVMVHHHAATLHIPTSVADIERTGIIVQALAYESSNRVIPAYYDIASKVKLVRDERSADMLDLIYANRSYDPIFIYEFHSSTAFENNCRANNKDIASYVASNEAAINEMIHTVTDAYAELEK